MASRCRDRARSPRNLVHLSPSGEPSAWTGTGGLCLKKTADLRRFLMELAGLEPATSWVRSNRLSGREPPYLQHISGERLECPNTFPNILQPVCHYDNTLRLEHDALTLIVRRRSAVRVRQRAQILQIGALVACALVVALRGEGVARSAPKQSHPSSRAKVPTPVRPHGSRRRGVCYTRGGDG
jgi:hypothetical protein